MKKIKCQTCKDTKVNLIRTGKSKKGEVYVLCKCSKKKFISNK